MAQITFISQEQERELYRDEQDLPKDNISLSEMSQNQGNLQWRNSDSLLLSKQTSLESNDVAASVQAPASPYPSNRLEPNRRMPETIPEIDDLARAERGQGQATSWARSLPKPKKPRVSHFVHNFRSPIGESTQ